MGIFSTKLRVWNPASSVPAEELEVMADTGASYSWILRTRVSCWVCGRFGRRNSAQLREIRLNGNWRRSLWQRTALLVEITLSWQGPGVWQEWARTPWRVLASRWTR